MRPAMPIVRGLLLAAFFFLSPAFAADPVPGYVISSTTSHNDFDTSACGGSSSCRNACLNKAGTILESAALACIAVLPQSFVNGAGQTVTSPYGTPHEVYYKRTGLSDIRYVGLSFTATLVCADGSLPVNGTCPDAPPPVNCSDTVGKTYSAEFVPGTQGSVINVDGCQYVYQGGAACIRIGSGNWTCFYVGNGNEAADGAVPATEPKPTDENADTNCVSKDGKQICVEQTAENCGTINGEYYCGENLPDTGECTFLPGGSYICSSDAPMPTTSDGGTMQPDGQFTTNDPATGTVQEWQYFNAGGGGGGVPDASGAETAQNTADMAADIEELKQGQCGGPNQPPCATEIDETGTPGPVGSGEFDGLLEATGIDGLAQGIGDSVTMDAPTWAPVLPEAQACQTITLAWGNAFTIFPDESQCAKLESIKEQLAYMLYLLTAFYLFSLAIRKPT